MFKSHPKGLLAASLSNMGERFGFYIMMSILVLFISAKYGISDRGVGIIYSTFYALIYLLALVGGIIADRTRKYKQTILTGIVLMAAGYLLIGFPTDTPVSSVPLYLTVTCLGLFIIAFGNGLFKGNLQAVVGQLYDNPEYAKKREAGFQIFYVFINVGSLIAPFIAVGLRNWWLNVNNFRYNGSLPKLCHMFLSNQEGMSSLQMDNLKTMMVESQIHSATAITDIGTFVKSYLNAFSRGFQFAFIAAIVMMLVSLIIFMVNRRKLPDPAKKEKEALASHSVDPKEVRMDAKEIKQRLLALFAVFGVVIFFWFAFHQNGYSLTLFTRDYINLDNFGFSIGDLHFYGAEIFQSINPFFVITLTPFVMLFFGALARAGLNLSTPMKIGFGMGIAALGYVFMMACSATLPSSTELAKLPEAEQMALRLTPWVMVGMYFIMTLAELFISPLGLAFVSKVAPPHLQGAMQGAWLGATAVGNQLLFIGGLLYTSTSLTMTWLVFVITCSVSMIVMFSMVRWLERITNKPIPA